MPFVSQILAAPAWRLHRVWTPRAGPENPPNARPNAHTNTHPDRPGVARKSRIAPTIRSAVRTFANPAVASTTG